RFLLFLTSESTFFQAKLLLVADSLVVRRNQADCLVATQMPLVPSLAVKILSKEQDCLVVIKLRNLLCLPRVLETNKELQWPVSVQQLPQLYKYQQLRPLCSDLMLIRPRMRRNVGGSVQMALLDAQIAASPYGDSPLLKLANVKDTDELPNPI
ncbi:hypothetical protein NECAME_00899, partial [Necator americanus]